MESAAPAAQAESKAEEAAESKESASEVKQEASGEKEVLEFYHGYYHDESEWAPAKAMRDIYDEFAKQHAIDATWGTDIANAIANKLVECTVSGVDVDAKFEELKNELLGLIG
ncbi:hypothetical protein [Eisenbergiella porci]|uniref:hypothetical protein n=1 Tax=Eisenbergiella porci TaxID=2652274 RepID=UPI002A81DE3F|nr:hypothetical protein [Eisenbergiella porci]